MLRVEHGGESVNEESLSTRKACAQCLICLPCNGFSAFEKPPGAPWLPLHGLSDSNAGRWKNNCSTADRLVQILVSYPRFGGRLGAKVEQIVHGPYSLLPSFSRATERVRG